MRPLTFRLFRRPLKAGGFVWWLDVRGGGRGRLREPCGTSKRSEAEQYREKRRRELGDPSCLPSDPAAYTVKEACDDMDETGLTDVAAPTAKMYRSKVGHVWRLLGELDVAALRAEDVAGFIETRRKEGAKDHTIAKELVTFRRALGHAERSGHLRPGWRGIFPARFRTGYDPRDRWLEPEEYLRLLEACEPDRRLWVQAGVYCGGRESELRRLDWRDIDFKRGFVTLRSAKTRKGEPRRPRHIPMAPELRQALEATRKLPDGTTIASGPVFPSPWVNPALMLTRMAWKAGIARAPVYERDLAGKLVLKTRGETVNDNDMRRTFASWMLQRGATVKEVADLLGHSSTQLVERVYGHLCRKNLIRAVSRLPRFTEAT